MTRRFWVGLSLMVPVFVLEMGAHLFDLHHLIGQQVSNWVQLLFGTPVVLWAGWPFFVRAWASVKNRNVNMLSLIAAGDCRVLALQLRRDRGAATASTAACPICH